MNENDFSSNFLNSLDGASKLAISFKNKEVESFHLLFNIIRNNEDFFSLLLSSHGVSVRVVKEQIYQQIQQIPTIDFFAEKPVLSKELNEVLLQSDGYRIMHNKEKVDSLDVVKSMVNLNSQSGRLLRIFQITEENIDATLAEYNPENFSEYKIEQKDGISLEDFAIDLVELARKKELDPVIGRDEETRRVINVLTRRTKNNPIITGESGVGTTSVCYGLAQRIAEGDVPSNLKKVKIYQLDLNLLKSGTAYQGELEKRVKSIVNQVSKSNGLYILFIDEISLIAGQDESINNIANIIKQELYSGKVRIIGTSNLVDYKKYIEKNSGLEKRFQKIIIEEPSEELALTILRGLKERYESFHQVRIDETALESAVKLAKRYINSRFLPDSAVDLIDEACSKIRAEINSKPTVLDRVQREIKNLSVDITSSESSSIKNEEKLQELQKRLSSLKEEEANLVYKWKREKGLIEKIQEAKRKQENLLTQKEAQTSEKKYELASQTSKEVGDVESFLKELEEELQEAQKEVVLIRDVVTNKEIEEIVSDKTGIFVSDLEQNETKKLLDIEKELGKMVVGQQEAINKIANAIRINRIPGIGNKKRPIGSFLFLGTTGVGKTLLAKKLSEHLFASEDAMVRIDMSEFSEKHSVSRLIGAPPGYVGFDEGGQLTEAIKNRPYCILLLDEIEKAHPETWNILLQILDDGRATDSQGREVNFKNTIIIMTSNIGSESIQRNFEENDNIISEEMIENTKFEVIQEVKQTMKPEIYNRIDEVVVFNPLDKDAVVNITKIELNKLKKSLKEDGGFNIIWTEDALNFIVEEGFNPAFGARPVNRAITSLIKEKMSLSILKEEINNQTDVIIDLKEGEIDFKNANSPTINTKKEEKINRVA